MLYSKNCLIVLVDTRRMYTSIDAIMKSMKSGASLLYSIFLIIGDSLALITAFAGAWFLRIHWTDKPFLQGISGETYLLVFMTLLPFWILTFALLGLYSSSIYERRFAEVGRLLIGSFIGLMFVIFWEYAINEPIFPARIIPVYGFVFGFLGLLLFRTVLRAIRTSLFRVGVGINHVLIVGNTLIAEELNAILRDSRRSGYKVIGVVGDRRRAIPADFISFEEAIAYIGKNPLHGVIQTELYADDSRNQEILQYAQKHHMGYRFVPGNTDLFVGNIDVELFRSSIPMIAVHQTALLGWGRFAKRLFDLFVGGVMLLVATPFMLIIGFINIFASGGIFFRQVRLTRYDQPFKVFKFRSQYKKYDGTTPEEAFALMGKPELAIEYRANGDQLDKDPRVTPFGRFLRSSSLDELPQLLNVVKGDISLVGPRALIPQELAAYPKKHTILSVKSGLTGLAQVSGRRDIPFEERRKLDLYYVQNWNFWLDITILFKTISTVIGKIGAK